MKIEILVDRSAKPQPKYRLRDNQGQKVNALWCHCIPHSHTGLAWLPSCLFENHVYPLLRAHGVDEFNYFDWEKDDG